MDSLHRALVAGDYEKVCELGRERVKTNATDAYARAVLGIGLLHRGKHDAAAIELAHAAHLDPDNAGTHFNLGLAREGHGDLEAAARAYRTALSLDPTLFGAALNLGSALLRCGDHDSAKEAYGRGLAIKPASPIAMHMVAALGGHVPASAPAEYVRQLFDAEAATFEMHLKSLEYKAPARLAEMIFEHDGCCERVLDLGCGTGLMGVALDGAPSLLVGVDLSARMLEKAREKTIYSELVSCDVVSYLDSDSRSWDLITAADVLVYVGELVPMFQAVRARLAPMGALAVSIERLETGDVALAPSGRFAHGLEYVARVASDCGLALVASSNEELRFERGQPVAGSILMFRAKTTG